MEGIWTQEGLGKLRDCINSGTGLELTHFVLSGSKGLGSLNDFSIDHDMTASEFSSQIFRAEVDYTYIDTAGFLTVMCQVAADIEETFYCNGIGLEFQDQMGRKWLMAAGTVPVQQHCTGVVNSFEMKLPILSDVEDIINVGFEPEDRVSNQQLSAAVKAHDLDEDSHSQWKNASGAHLLFLTNHIGMIEKERKIDSEVRNQTGIVTLQNRGIIKGCNISVSQDATRNINISDGVCFKSGCIIPVDAQKNGADITENKTSETAYCFIYLNENGELTSTGLNEPLPENTVKLYKAVVPAGSTEETAARLEGVSFTDLRRIEKNYPHFYSNPEITYIQLLKELETDRYQIDLTVLKYEGSDFGLGDVKIKSQASNGFSVFTTGIADNIELRWNICKKQ